MEGGIQYMIQPDGCLVDRSILHHKTEPAWPNNDPGSPAVCIEVRLHEHGWPLRWLRRQEWLVLSWIKEGADPRFHLAKGYTYRTRENADILYQEALRELARHGFEEVA